MLKSQFTLFAAVLLTLGACLPLFAQPQVLPSVEIRSDTSLKAPLLKKPVSFPVEVPADSIPPQIPPVFLLRHKFPALPQGTIRPLYLELFSDTSREYKLAASYYPAWKTVPLLKLDADLWMPSINMSRGSVNAGVQSNFPQDLRFNHRFSWQQAQAWNFNTETLSYSAANLYPDLDLKELRFSLLRTNLSLESFQQNLNGARDSDFALGIRHSHGLKWSGHQLFNRVVLQDTAFGISAQYRTPWLGQYLPELDLGLMTDFIHVMPAIDWHKRILLARGRYLEISNRTELQNRTFQTWKELYPWSVMPQRERLVMTPLNFSVSGWQAFSDEDALFRLAGVKQTIRFSYNQPELTVRDVSGQTYLSQTDIFSYRLAADLRLGYRGWEIDQDLNLNLEYLQDDNWRRRPFSPGVSAKTKAGYSYGDLDILATLNQEYWRRDENDQKLPGIFDLGLGVSFPIGPDLCLSASLENIFNSAYHNIGNLPSSGQTFRIAFRYLPLR